MNATAYELMFIVKPDIAEENAKTFAEKVKEVIEKNEGQISNFEFLGKKELATEFVSYKQGYYFLINFSGENKTLTSLEATLKVSEDILRRLLVKESSLKPKEEPVAKEA